MRLFAQKITGNEIKISSGFKKKNQKELVVLQKVSYLSFSILKTYFRKFVQKIKISKMK